MERPNASFVFLSVSWAYFTRLFAKSVFVFSIVASTFCSSLNLCRPSSVRLYAQILFDFLEEELDLPAVFIDVGDGFRRKPEMVGQKFVVFPGF